jgi:hypothetical protein
VRWFRQLPIPNPGCLPAVKPAKNTTLVPIPSPWRSGSGVRDERGGVGGGAAAAGRPGGGGGGTPPLRRHPWRSGSGGSRGRWGCGCQRDRGGERRRGGRARVPFRRGWEGPLVQLNYRQTRNEPPEGYRMSKPLRRTVPPCKLLLLSTFEILRDSQTGLGGISSCTQAQHDWKNIGSATVKFKSVWCVTAIWREIARLTIIGSGSGYFSDPKIRSRCVICRAR